MSYFPKHYITTNQYTAGGEFAYKSSQVEYAGYYWKTGNGRFYTGQTPQASQTIELVKILIVSSGEFSTENPLYTEKIHIATGGEGPNDYGVGSNLPTIETNIENYSILKNKSTAYVATKFIPPYNAPIPTQQDYQNGEFRRYFCKKTNELQYIELNLQTYTLLVQKSPTIEWTLYQPFNIPWQLTGDKNQVRQVNKNITLYNIKKFNLPKLDQYLKLDYTKYFLFPNISNLYTPGGEFKTADGKNYIGFYHIHDKTGPMVGKVHPKVPHPLLFPINEDTILNITTQYNIPSVTRNTGSYTPPPMNRGGGGGSGGGSGGGGGY